jgi:hypothetical protein
MISAIKYKGKVPPMVRINTCLDEEAIYKEVNYSWSDSNYDEHAFFENYIKLLKMIEGSGFSEPEQVGYEMGVRIM